MEKRDLYNRYKENTKFTILKEQEVYHRRKTSRSRTIEEQPALKL